jgi:hypothetical protein
VRYIFLGLFFLSLSAFLGCRKQASTLSIIPHIEFLRLSKSTIILDRAVGESDSINLTITIADGDGDIGVNSDGDTTSSSLDCTDHSQDSLTIANKSYNLLYYIYKSSNQGDSCISSPGVATRSDIPVSKDGSLTGEISFFPVVSCPPAPLNSDTVFFSVFVKDKAGHLSNRVRSTPIIISCK